MTELPDTLGTRATAAALLFGIGYALVHTFGRDPSDRTPPLIGGALGAAVGAAFPSAAFYPWGKVG